MSFGHPSRTLRIRTALVSLAALTLGVLAPAVAHAQLPGNNDDKEEGDKAEEKKMPARLPWRGTAVSWGHSVTTSALGIGDDFQSDAQQVYRQNFSIGLNYFLIDQKGWSIAVATSAGFNVELTNSAVTTTEREPQFNDMPVSIVYRRVLYASKTKPLVSFIALNNTAILPTSPISSGNGTYLTYSPRAAFIQTVPLFDKKTSPVLNAITFGVSGRWDHRFGRATTPVNSDLNRPRQNAVGDTFLSDQLSFNPIATDSLREGAFIFLSERLGGHTLQLFVAASLNQQFLPEFEGNDCEVEIDTGCVKAEGGEDPRTVNFGAGFSAGLSYFPMSEFGFSLGYSSSGNQLGPDGQRRSVFYNPAAQFSAGMVVSLDAIYEGITGPRRANPFVLLAKNDKKRRRDDEKKTPRPVDSMPARF